MSFHSVGQSIVYAFVLSFIWTILTTWQPITFDDPFLNNFSSVSLSMLAASFATLVLTWMLRRRNSDS